MYDAPLAPAVQPPPFPEKPKSPVVGILSCAAAALAILMVCGVFILAYSVGSSGQFDPNNLDYQSLAGLGFGVLGLCLGSVFFSLVGIILGIFAIFQKGTARVWGIVGLVVNSLIVLSYCGLYGLGALSA